MWGQPPRLSRLKPALSEHSESKGRSHPSLPDGACRFLHIVAVVRVV